MLTALHAQITSGPCSRRTSIVLSEIHYHPPGEAVANREFIELYNSSPISVDLSGWKLRGDADFDFPEGTRLEGGQFLIVAADPSLFEEDDITALGPWSSQMVEDASVYERRPEELFSKQITTTTPAGLPPPMAPGIPSF
ncbi:lamin tail domain-containing protein [bacterium]|nr:lamin tail domain-containing protein [bacterium]